MYNPFSLKGKTIFITGASSGIGRATAIECSKLGATVVITGRNKERLNETYTQLEGNGHIQLIADLNKTQEIEKLLSNLPVIDGCVNNAGIVKTTLTSFITNEALNEVMQTNTIAPILLTQQLIKRKLKRVHPLFLHRPFQASQLHSWVMYYILLQKVQ